MTQPILDQSNEGPQQPNYTSDFTLRTPSIQLTEVLLFLHASLLTVGLYYSLQFFDQLTVDTLIAWPRNDFELILPIWLLYIIVPVLYALTWRIRSIRIDNSPIKSSTESNLSIVLIVILFIMSILSLIIGLSFTAQCIYRIESFKVLLAASADLTFSLHSYYLYKTITQDNTMKKLLKQ